jgi:hypothetical protein
VLQLVGVVDDLPHSEIDVIDSEVPLRREGEDKGKREKRSNRETDLIAIQKGIEFIFHSLSQARQID